MAQFGLTFKTFIIIIKTPFYLLKIYNCFLVILIILITLFMSFRPMKIYKVIT